MIYKKALQNIGRNFYKNDLSQIRTGTKNASKTKALYKLLYESSSEDIFLLFRNFASRSLNHKHILSMLHGYIYLNKPFSK